LESSSAAGEDGTISDEGDRATPGDDEDSVGDGLIISFLLLDLIIDMFLLIANYLVLSYACKVFLNFKLSLSFRVSAKDIVKFNGLCKI
jgi:hypothetical protein